MSVETILGYISDFGILPIVVALLIYLIVKLSKRNDEITKKMDEQNKKIDERDERLKSENSQLYDNITKTIAPEHTVEEEENGRRINNYIDSQLTCLLREYGANRAYFFIYHNGGKDMTGRSFQKMSIANEAVDVNTVPLMNSYQNIPRAMFPTLFRTISSQDKLTIKTPDDIKEADPVFYQMMRANNVCSSFIHGIRRSDGVIIGFLVAEYVSSDCSDFAAVEEAVEKKAQRISGAMATKETKEATK